VKDWQAPWIAPSSRRRHDDGVPPARWIKNDQLVELVDYADKKHGKKVKFLNFREALERLEKHALGGKHLRNADNPAVCDVHVVDPNRDGYCDVLVLDGPHIGKPSSIRSATCERGCQLREAGDWKVDRNPGLLRREGMTPAVGKRCSGSRSVAGFLILSGDDRRHGVIALDWGKKANPKFSLPPGAVASDMYHDYGLRFIDLDGDGNDDVIFSNEREYGVYLFKDIYEAGPQGDRRQGGRAGRAAMIANKGENMGFWSTPATSGGPRRHAAAQGPRGRVSIKELLNNVDPPAKAR